MKKLTAFHSLEDLEPPFFKFSKHSSVRKSGEKLQTNIWKISSKLEKFKHGYAPKIFSTILCLVALVYDSYFFQKSRFTEIIRH